MSAADLSACRLYGILDLSYVEPAKAPSVAEQMIAGGVDLLQLRAKRESAPAILEIARRLREVTKARVPFIINDHAEIAREVQADGVHIGQDDGSVAEARRILGASGFVGKSTHSLAQARAAEAEGADYLGFGPLFATPTKPDYQPIGLEEIKIAYEAARLPIFCIGGIKLENLPQVIAAGAERIVIVSGLLQAADIAEYARAARALLP